MNEVKSNAHFGKLGAKFGKLGGRPTCKGKPFGLSAKTMVKFYVLEVFLIFLRSVFLLGVIKLKVSFGFPQQESINHVYI